MSCLPGWYFIIPANNSLKKQGYCFNKNEIQTYILYKQHY